MLQRILVAVVGIPFLLLVLIWAPAWATMLLVVVMCVFGSYELLRAAAGERGKRLIPLAALMAALVPLDLYQSRPLYVESLDQMGNSIPGLYAAMSGTADLGPAGPSFLAPLGFLFLLALFLDAILHYEKERDSSFGDLTAALFAGLAFPLMLSCLLRLRLMENGVALVFLPLAISFGSDTFAYFVGITCGKHKLSPRVSPKKSVEGAVGGLLGGVIGMAVVRGVVAWTMGVVMFSWGEILLLGILGSAVSQIGDLSFSVIKREFGVKDYGKLLPGHGGILDRFDSVTFVAPFIWFVFSFLR